MTASGETDTPWNDGLMGARRNTLARLLAKNRPLVMGILNVTPDSFSDGGQFATPQAAIDHAALMIGQGADIIDIGGESSRPYPGAKPVSLEEELARLQPVLPHVVRLGTPVSIDTIKPEIALWALGEGAWIVNDVWGLQREPNMARVVAEHSAPVIVMHNRYKAEPSINIISDINAFFSHSIDLAVRAGLPRDMIVLDPGIGFGKTPEQSIEVIAKLDTFRRFELPILIGASRKRFINAVSESEPKQRLGGSIAADIMAFHKGANIIRTHDVAETIQALRVTIALRDIQ